MEVGERYQMLLQSQGIRQGLGWLDRFIRRFETGSPGDFEELGGSKTECIGSSVCSLGVRRTWHSLDGGAMADF